MIGQTYSRWVSQTSQGLVEFPGGTENQSVVCLSSQEGDDVTAVLSALSSVRPSEILYLRFYLSSLLLLSFFPPV